ncbi:gliding motility lipoprotein GldH [candidate division KSB1 bacterium]
MDRQKTLLFLIFFFFIVLISCDNTRVFDESISISENGWDYNKSVKLETEIMDTTSLHNFYINIRNSTDYSYSNIYLFVKTVFPNGRVSRDTVQAILANKEGNWIGKGSGKIRDNQILISKNFRFPYQGMYVFEIEQAMREKTLLGIKDIGIRIEKQL